MIKRHTIATTILIIAISTVISIFFWISYHRIDRIYEEETRSTVINMRKLFLKSTVNNIIQEIDMDRTNEHERYRKSIELRYETLAYEQKLDAREFTEYFINWFGNEFSKDINKNEWTVFLWNTKSRQVLYDPAGIAGEDILGILKEVKPQMSYYRIVTHGEIYGFIGVSKEYIDNRVKKAAAKRIRSLKYDSGSYVWVNEIINYAGGEDYAIRLVHPNLPETEGMYLSTDMTDIKGSRPYLIELNGIKRNGELFFTYYFKELNSNIVSEKLTYAKLYKDFDWIIDMGIPLDDIKQYIDRTNEKSRILVRSQMITLGIILFIIVGISLILLLSLERLHGRRIRRQMELEMNEDSLSKAYSRRYGTIELTKAFRDFKRKKTEDTAIILFDVDRFKGVNDSFGHDTGDKMLVEIVNAVHQVIRSSDSLIRWGGDEFVGIFRGLKEEYSVGFAEKVLTAIASLSITVGDERLSPTISMGIAYFREKDESIEEVLKRADLAMYQSKKEGRNKVTLYNEKIHDF